MDVSNNIIITSIKIIIVIVIIIILNIVANLFSILDMAPNYSNISRSYVTLLMEYLDVQK